MATPYAASQAYPVRFLQIRRIGQDDLNWALAEGWRDFKAKRGDLIVVGLLYPLICLMAVVVTLNNPLLPFLFPLVAGLSIAGPAVASGFYELARRREAGLNASWWHFLDPLKGRSRWPIALLTIMLGLLFVGWLIAAYAVYAANFGFGTPLRVQGLAGQLFSTNAGWRMIIIGNLVGLGFAIATLMVSVVSFPMVVDRPVDAGVAVRTSIHAVWTNPIVMLSWGVRIAIWLVIGLIPLAIGLAVVLPWLGYSTWHLYTRIVER
ncbi:DUF2189 domain-containing protein [Sphingomonas sp. 28-63-12]|uniref:DUF2189 domain-containing protein n=1 Tax=Sphingomonas sp. 28-63-12 TaxID=1970434 RepID=UPI000BD05F58|nr:MAG: hypothetical protein B7Y47_02835 [Sphingomonas sp. 28-63-12]